MTKPDYEKLRGLAADEQIEELKDRDQKINLMAKAIWRLSGANHGRDWEALADYQKALARMQATAAYDALIFMKAQK